jgi:hypothetical protein|uniref:Major capsid protein N-terminal domain-containing protein n=1 Tax=viral metagenome TaxID=1070528 RepID=A0A6C0IPW6_9ZZZZ
MTGGLMNLTAQGNENIILNGNPKKTFFKAVYAKHTNFGLQRFRIDFEGNRVLNFTTPTVLDFKIPRYAEMLHDTYVVVTLPHIYSPLVYDGTAEIGRNLVPYEFRWIEEIGTNMISEVEIYSGGITLARYSGEYISCLKERDLSLAKKNLWNRMTGNIPEIYDPGNSNGNVNVYPNSMYMDESGVEPSIRSRKLYVPLDSFFCQSSKLSLPLVALQYSEISIRLTFRPTYELYSINNINDIQDDSCISYRIQPNPNEINNQLWRFLQPPQDVAASHEFYNTTRNDWNSDVHLISTYIFLDQAERQMMAAQPHNILIKQVHTFDFLGQSGSKVLNLESRDLVSGLMFRYRRSDAKFRNEWSNYSNWAYNNVVPQQISDELPLLAGNEIPNPNNFHITGAIGEYPYNQKHILSDFALIMGGVYRENLLDSGVYNYIEKYVRSVGGAKDGLYCYNFGLNSEKKHYQPSGAMNVNKFGSIDIEFNTIEPPFNPEGAIVDFICDTSSNPIGFRKSTGSLNTYNYDLRIFEERYNVLVIKSGRVGLMMAR